MKQAKILIDEINRKKEAVKKTNSQHLKRDYNKSIQADLRELREYCLYRGLDYYELIKGVIA